jgi:hypothetical protein
LLETLGARLLAAFLTEHTENSFSRLPVRAGENVFISTTAFANAKALASHEAALAASPQWQAFAETARADLVKPTELLRLSPTSRPLLR